MRFNIIVLMFFSYFSLSASGQTISGQVIDAADGLPIPSGTVIVQRDGNTRIDTVFTDNNGQWQYTMPSSDITDHSKAPTSPHLFANYPNPFNPSTTIAFYLPQNNFISLIVYNALGQEVARKEAFLSAGTHQIKWRSHGPAGVYFYQLQYGDKYISHRMIQLDGGQSGGLTDFRSSDFSAEINGLKKSTTVTMNLIVNKFAYWPDTLQAAISHGDYFRTPLQTVHAHAILVDLHNDVLEQIQITPDYHLNVRHSYFHTDIPRLRQGRIDIQFFSVWVNPDRYGSVAYQTALDLFQILNTESALNPIDLQKVTTVETAFAAIQEKKIAFIFAVEGGHVIENDLNKLCQLYHLGMRCLTITWNNSTNWATSAQDQRSKTRGLSEFGKKVIRCCDSLGVLIDVSHVGSKTIQDILATSKNPIIASHSGARSLRDSYRNLDDEQIRAIAGTGGVIGVIFYPPFLVNSGEQADVNSVVAHIDHIVQVAGIDYVAVGSDFDGFNSKGPRYLEDTSAFANLTLILLRHGYSATDVEKILGGNVLRILKQVCKLKF